MMNGQTPQWLRKSERYFGWLAIPHISILFVTLQALGFLLVLSDPIWVSRLALIPERVIQGEYWRLITFLSLPLSLSPLWVIFVLWFIYFILEAIESEWGEYKTTLYVLTSVLLTIAMSFAFSYPITQVSDFESTLFLAAATLFPELEVSLFLILPVKMKWLGWLTLGFVLLKFVQAEWVGRFYLLAIYSNYFLFFGPSVINQIRQAIRRANFRRKFKR